MRHQSCHVGVMKEGVGHECQAAERTWHILLQLLWDQSLQSSAQQSSDAASGTSLSLLL